MSLFYEAAGLSAGFSSPLEVSTLFLVMYYPRATAYAVIIEERVQEQN